MPGLLVKGRLATIGLALSAGAGVGALAWWILATGAADQRRLQEDQLEVSGLKLPGRPPSIVGALAAGATAHPLFVLTTGPGARPEPVILVSGLARTPTRRAALLAVNGSPPTWLGVGQSAGDVTLLDVQPSKAVVETPFGRKEIDLEAQASPATPPPPAGVHPPNQIPPGAHLPPAPADAP